MRTTLVLLSLLFSFSVRAESMDLEIARINSKLSDISVQISFLKEANLQISELKVEIESLKKQVADLQNKTKRSILD